MLLRVATGRVPDYSEGQDPLVFVVVDADVVAMQYPVVMTDIRSVRSRRFSPTWGSSTRDWTGR